jgi:hypothetical protein
MVDEVIPGADIVIGGLVLFAVAVAFGALVIVCLSSGGAA